VVVIAQRNVRRPDARVSPKGWRGNAAPITFEWEWQGKRGTKRGPDGEPTNISSYTLNFDRMEQKNNDTGVVRKFRVVQVGME